MIRRLAVLFVLVIVSFLLMVRAHHVPAEFRDYGVKVQGCWLGKNQQLTIRVPVTEDGWSSVEVWVPKRFLYEVERANGTFEKVERGCSTLTTSCETARIIRVYRKDDRELISIHKVIIHPIST